MKLLASKKAILAILGVSSVVVASTYRDIKSTQIVENKIEENKDELLSQERSVASEEAPSKVAKLYLPLNEMNIKKINGSWDISRIIGVDEKAAFDKFQNPEDAKKSIRVKFELVGNGLVRIDNDNEQIYHVSILTDFGTIAIYKKLGNGFEIIEAKKLMKQVANNTLESTTDETDLILERALNQTKGNKVLTGADVSGRLTLKGNNLSNLSVTLRNQNGEDQTIDIDSADIMDGGAFKAENMGEEISGILFNNGKDGYRLSFVTGPMAGAMLNFVTQEQYDIIQEKEQETIRDQADLGSAQDEKLEEKQASQEADSQQNVIQAPPMPPVQIVNPDGQVEEMQMVQEAQMQQVEERQLEAMNLPENQQMTTDQIKDVAQQNGFSF